MDITFELILKLSQSEDFVYYKTEKLENEASTYKIEWRKKDATNNSITMFSIHYKFDMISFLQIYESLYPKGQIGEKYVMDGIAHCFKDLAPFAISFGNHNYKDLAKLIYEKRGTIIGKEFGF